MVLDHGELDRGDLILVIGTVQIDRERISVVLDVVDGIAQGRDLCVIPVRNTEIDPLGALKSGRDTELCIPSRIAKYLGIISRKLGR